jgi:DNA-binding MarR family transcriptional regulator
MDIQQEIVQSRFSSEYHKLWVNIVFTANWLRAAELRIFRPYAISPQQYNVLRILRGQHPLPASLHLIRERMLDRESNASRLVDKLCEAGLASRVECPVNRRKVDIRLTDKGVELLLKLDPEAAALVQKIACIGEENAACMNGLLDLLRNPSTEQTRDKD